MNTAQVEAFERDCERIAGALKMLVVESKMAAVLMQDLLDMIEEQVDVVRGEGGKGED